MAALATVTRWRKTVEDVLRNVWPQLPEGPRWILAQIHQESNGKPDAVSHVGAAGLMQLMPDTADEVGVRDPFNAEDNIRGGITYLRKQHDKFPEIPDYMDRIRFSLAAYNGGRGWANRALKCAAQDLNGAPESKWWIPVRYWLMSRDCVIAGKHPDYLQIWDYVENIELRKDDYR